MVTNPPQANRSIFSNTNASPAGKMSAERWDDGRPATPGRTHTQGENTMSNWLVAVLFYAGLLAVGGWAGEKPSQPASPKPDDKGKDKKPDFRAEAVRYQVKDVDKAVEFYTKHLGFELDKRYPSGPPFAAVSNGNLTLWLSGPKSSGARPLS